MKGNKNTATLTKESLKSSWKNIWIHKSNHVLLKHYSKKYQMSMTSALHMLFGVASKCVEEKHEQEIVDLKKRLSLLAQIVITYRAKYGDIGRKNDVGGGKRR